MNTRTERRNQIIALVMTIALGLGMIIAGTIDVMQNGL